jgi:hypothetical protein
LNIGYWIAVKNAFSPGMTIPNTQYSMRLLTR